MASVRFLFFLTLFATGLMHSIEIKISISKQTLTLQDSESIIKSFRISSSKYGEGFQEGSFQTPLGLHEIKSMIGDEVPIGGRFIGRQYYGEIFPIYSDVKQKVSEDVIQTRILWLTGLEEGKNKGGSVDSFNRYIYIHGTPEEWLLGEKASKGCIRMSNKDVIELFSLVRKGTRVDIIP